MNSISKKLALRLFLILMLFSQVGCLAKVGFKKNLKPVAKIADKVSGKSDKVDTARALLELKKKRTFNLIISD